MAISGGIMGIKMFNYKAIKKFKVCNMLLPLHRTGKYTHRHRYALSMCTYIF